MSSQPVSQFDTSSSFKVISQPSRFFAPATQNVECSELPQSQAHIEIPATQPIPSLVRSELNTSTNSLSSGATLLDVISEHNDKSNDGFPMISQNVFAEISGNNLIQDEDDEMKGIEILTEKVLNNKDTDSSSISPISFESAREGSVTPELDFASARDIFATPSEMLKVKPEPPSLQSEIATQLVIYEDVKKQVYYEDLRQAEIDTQRYEDSDSEKEEKFNPLMGPTQPIFQVGSRTRLHSKRQAAIKPKTISLTDFDETQLMSPSPKKVKHCYSLETQPVFFSATQKSAGGSGRNPKTVNRILLSSDEESNDGVTIISQPFLKQTVSTTKTPETRRTDSPLLPNYATPEMLPRLPSGSQIEPFLDLINATQETFDSVVAFDTTPADDYSKKIVFEAAQNIMQNGNEITNMKKPRRRIMKYASDSDDDDVAPVSLAKSNKTGETKSKKKEPESNFQEAGSSKKPEVQKEPKLRSKNVKKPESQLPIENKIYSIAISNITDAEEKSKCIADCTTLGCRLVDSIRDADLLLTKNKIKLTAKFLASVCKGIPIVDSKFVDASCKSGHWLNPNCFIIYDPEMEIKKTFSLKSLLERTATNNFLQNVSVFVTTSTLIPFVDMKEIIEIAGGECLGQIRQVPRFENLAMIYSEKDNREKKSIVNKYPNIIQSKDSSFCGAVLRQEF